MNNEVISKIIDTLKNRLILTVRKKDSNDELRFMYDTNTNTYSVTLTRVKEDGKKDIKEKVSLTLEEVISFIQNPEFSGEMLNIYDSVLMEEKKYEETKQRLLQELESMEDISDKDRKNMRYIIEKVSKHSKNRVTLMMNQFEDGFFIEELRLADETNWSSAGSTLHLQLVQRLYDHGMNGHSYPKKTFREIVEYVSSLDISLEEKSEKSSDEDER